MPAVLNSHLESIKHQLFGKKQLDKQTFEELALQIFLIQANNNLVYKAFIEQLDVNIQEIQTIEAIPFLPIEFFKTHDVILKNYQYSHIFKSSGTTQQTRSKHLIADIALYQHAFTQDFEKFYGKANQYCILALLPSYLEQGNSSLVYMLNELIKQSEHPNSGFYLYNFEELFATLQTLEKQKQKTILFGVSYALLDFAEKFPMPLNFTTIIETGGMKGRRKEMIREELHGLLKQAFRVEQIHSEYGMTELLSQAYLQKDNLFKPGNFMKVLIREYNDPFNYLPTGQTGGINVIDLANIYSCSFIATQDLGKCYDDGSFEVLGRFDNSDTRGCNLMVE